MAEYTYNEDIDALAAFLLRVRNGDDPWADPDHAKDWSRAITALIAERDAAIKQRDGYRDALERIANQDYRGNRSAESQIAFAALAAMRKRDANG